tara:strand:+ start:138 stop:701 length:564 start_codon:yes stop_codon:yes gene_type:complete
LKRVNFNTLPKDILIPKDDGLCNHLYGMEIPDISLLTTNGDYLKLRRKESFRLVLYFYPMTGRPDAKLPNNWNNIPGARGCTVENISFADNYDELIKLNAVPIGITSQNIQDIKEMTSRLKVSHDILSDYNLDLAKLLRLPTFSVDGRTYIKRLTLIVDNLKVVKVFYPIFPPDKHINDVILWLKNN